MDLDICTSLKIIKNNDINSETFDFKLLTDVFRFLRNSCATDPENQKVIANDLDALIKTRNNLLHLTNINTPSVEQELCLVVGLQFLANFLVDNLSNQFLVWEKCQNLLKQCLKFKNPKVQNTTGMILYNIFLGKPQLMEQLRHPLEDLIEMTTDETTSEFALYTLELFITKSTYIYRFYESLKQEHRLLILEVLKNLISEQQDQNIKPEVLKFFSNYFTKKSDCILKTCESYTNSLDPVEVVKVLEVLVAFSSDDHGCYLNCVQKETSLLINCVMLLKNIHSISKESGNNFSMLNKISDVSEAEKSSSVQEHPIFGFKCSLIRLVGNFCWKNSENQNKVRELECIPVLLDCCNIDGRNPFIIQWCILAIRNICEKNFENQKFIASMSKEGKVDPARLKELGIVLNDDGKGESVCIAPYKT